MSEAAVSAIPATVDDIDAAWLTSALSQRFPGVEVIDAKQVDAILGACAKIRVALSYNDAGEAAGLPPTLIVKGNFGRQGPQLDFMFQGEMRSYRDVISDLGINSPRCFFAGGEGGRTALLLEDLATPDCIFGSVPRPLSFEEVDSVLAQLAILHSRYWNAPELEPGAALDWIDPTLTGDHLAFLQAILAPEAWNHFRSHPRGVAAPRETAGDPARLEAALLTQQELHRRAPQTLVHGDSHGANIYFNRHGGGLFDWFLRKGPWFHDVTYLIAGALDIGDRRRWERVLLDRYLQRLLGYGIDAPSLDEAFECYRRELIFGYVLLMGIGEPGEYWEEAAITAAVTRFAMAAEDHRMLDAIETEVVS